MKISKLDHVAIVCNDTNVSKDWYTKIFGMEWIHRGLWGGNPIFLRKGDCFLALFQSGTKTKSIPSSGPRIDHFAFRTETLEDYKAAKKEFDENRIGYEEQDHEISHSIYLKDPDGNTVEITTYDI